MLKEMKCLTAKICSTSLFRQNSAVENSIFKLLLDMDSFEIQTADLCIYFCRLFGEFWLYYAIYLQILVLT